MEEIALQVHTAGQEPHEIMAPPEIETGEFIRELVAGLRLPGDVIWEADDKDTGHTLVPGRTLHQNGVRSGHHLYLKSREPDPQVVPDTDPKEPHIVVPPQRSKWPLILTAALIPLVGLGAFFLGSSRNQQLNDGLRSAQAAVTDANQRASAAEAHTAQFQRELDDVHQKEGGASAQVTQLNSQIAQLNQELDRRQKQIKADQLQATQLNQQITQLHTSAAGDQDQVKRLQASAQTSAQQIATLQNDLNAKTQALGVLEQQVRALSTSKGKSVSLPARPNYGWLTWTGDIPKGNVVEIRDNQPSVGNLGGKLPGMACTVEAAEPDNVSIEAAPDAATAWNRVVFKIKGKGKTTVRLLWVVR
jgi:outer membrane murein-binding lipoprotein Lpp